MGINMDTNKKKETDEKFVLYADIMGFKERIMRITHEDLGKDLETLMSSLTDWFEPFAQNVESFKVSFFSDSILIIDNSTKDGFNRISKAAAGLMHVFLKESFPIKGVISKGKFTYNKEKNLLFGQALVDAYLLQEEVHYYGIVAHHSVDKDIKKFAKGWLDKNGKLKNNPYIISPIPFKSGTITHYHLAYNLISCKREVGKETQKTNKKIIQYLNNIRETVSGAPRIYVDKTLGVLSDDLCRFENKKQGAEFPLTLDDIERNKGKSYHKKVTKE